MRVVVDETNKNTDFKVDGKWVLRTGHQGKFMQTRLGVLHNNMTQRCKVGGRLQTYHSPFYSGVICSEEFADPQRFCDWAVDQVGWGNPGWQLDKDLLVPGNRVYSAETCVFLPQEVNAGIIQPGWGKYLPGTWPEYKRWRSALKIKKQGVYLGTYHTELEAHQAYCEFRELHVAMLADKWRNEIDPRAYAALLNWKVGPRAPSVLH